MNGEGIWITGASLLWVSLAYLIERGHHRETRAALDHAIAIAQAERLRAERAERRATVAQRAVIRGGFTLRELEEDVL